MFLQRLADYGRRIAEEDGEERLPPMYQRVPIRYIIRLDREGRLLGKPSALIDTATEGQTRGFPMAAPTRIRTSGISPKLLADTAVYTLGVAREDDNAKHVV